MWGGTGAQAPNCLCRRNFNPPSPCGEGRQKYTKIFSHFMHFRQILSHFLPPHPVFWERIKNRRRISQNFSAKVSGKSWALPPRTGLDHQGPAGIVAGFHPIVGDLFRIVVSQIIDPQAVLFPVHNGHKFCLQGPQNTTLHRSRHTYSPEMNHSQASTEICPVPTLAISSMWQNFFESPLLYSANFANHSFRTLLR